MPKKYDVKLLAPVGNWENLHTAIAAGCDEIYFGVKNLNMRAGGAKNFDIEELPKIAEVCHKSNVKCYLALNVVLYDSEMSIMHKIVDKVKEVRVDGIIAMDLAAIIYAHKVGVEVHISVQAGISNSQAVKHYAQWSDRVVLARELTLSMQAKVVEEIKKQNICGPKGELVEVEVFAHGALCVSVSGKCGMSLLANNKSANRGVCLQPCRRAYTVTDKETGQEFVVDNEYVMSSQDLCTVGFLDKLLQTGIKVLKIEGRGRGAEYVDTVIRVYREAIDAVNEGTFTLDKIQQYNERLGTVFNRGLSEGYYLGKSFKDWAGIYGSRATKNKKLVGKVLHYFDKLQVAEITLQADDLATGEEYLISGGDEDKAIVRGSVQDLRSAEGDSIMLAKKGTIISLKVSQPVRKGDQVYKMVPNEDYLTSRIN